MLVCLVEGFGRTFVADVHNRMCFEIGLVWEAHAQTSGSVVFVLRKQIVVLFCLWRAAPIPCKGGLMIWMKRRRCTHTQLPMTRHRRPITTNNEQLCCAVLCCAVLSCAVLCGWCH